MSPNRELTVAIRLGEAEKARKITKIADLNGDGFSILVPCHKAQSGYLFKQPMIPGVPRPRFVAWESAITFTAKDKAKLSYHKDGFVEFCSDVSSRITSSRDPVSGEAKGLGLFSAPLARPPFGGPIARVDVYGIDQFETADERDELIIFDPSDFYYRNCSPENANFWMLMIYVFPKNITPPVRFKQKRSIVQIAIEPANGPMASIMELAVVYFPGEKMFLGLCVNCLNARLQSDSGWCFNGPGEFTTEGRGHRLMGIHPRTEIPSDEQASIGSNLKASASSPGNLSHRKPGKQGSSPTKGDRNKSRK